MSMPVSKAVSLALAAAAAAILAAPAVAAEDLAAQIDAIVPLVDTGELEALGGPDTAAGLIEGIDGRWFTLDNVVRNWEREDRLDALARAVERLCSDDWENILTLTANGPDRIFVHQVSPEGRDNGSFELIAVDPEGRGFTFEFDEQATLAAYELEGADPARQEAFLSEVREAAEYGNRIWRPTPDLMVTDSYWGVEVTGRCPTG